MVHITSSIDGFRRCGVAHSKELTKHEDDAFTKEQLKTLQAEPVLQVEVVPTKEKK